MIMKKRAHSGGLWPAGRIALRKASALCGMAAPLFCLGSLLTVTLLNPAYSSATQRISELGAPQAPYAALANTLGIGATGLLVALFSLGLNNVLRRSRTAAMGSALIGLAGVAVTLAGVLPSGMDGAEAPRTAMAHAILARAGELAIIGAALALWLGLKGSGQWRGFSGLSLAVVVALVALYVPYQLHSLAPWKGVLQRLIVLVVLGWVEIMSIKLLSLPAGAGEEYPDADPV